MTTRQKPGDAPSCVLNIEELVLHGFERADRHVIADALEAELQRLLAAPGSQDGLRAQGDRRDGHRIDAGSFTVPAGTTPVTVGVEIARAIHRGLGASDRPREPVNPAATRGSPTPGGGR